MPTVPNLLEVLLHLRHASCDALVLIGEALHLEPSRLCSTRGALVPAHAAHARARTHGRMGLRLWQLASAWTLSGVTSLS